jgi:hypothetical protein
VAVAQHPSLQIFRANTTAQDLVLDSFAQELRDLVSGFREVTLAEFLITSIDVKREEGLTSTAVRYDIVGKDKDAWRAERPGAERRNSKGAHALSTEAVHSDRSH